MFKNISICEKYNGMKGGGFNLPHNVQEYMYLWRIQWYEGGGSTYPIMFKNICICEGYYGMKEGVQPTP